MYEEAESSSSSILKEIFGNIDVLSEEALGDRQLYYDMLESAGMVLVQSLHGLGRTVEIVKELRDVFGEIAAIPVQVLLTGCLGVSWVKGHAWSLKDDEEILFWMQTNRREMQRQPK